MNVATIGGVPVQAASGSTWWTRLFQLSECVSLTRVPKCRFGVFGGDWFAAAVVGGVGGPVAGAGVLPFDGDLDVDAEQPGEDGGGKFGGEAEQWGGAALRGAQSELAQSFGELVGADRLAGAATGEQPGGGSLVAERGVAATSGGEVDDQAGEWFGQRYGFVAEAEAHWVFGGLHILEGEAADRGGGLRVEEHEQPATRSTGLTV